MKGCNKMRYETCEEARAQLRFFRKQRKKGMSHRKERKMYACGRCHGYHLTSARKVK